MKVEKRVRSGEASPARSNRSFSQWLEDLKRDSHYTAHRDLSSPTSMSGAKPRRSTHTICATYRPFSILYRPRTTMPSGSEALSSIRSAKPDPVIRPRRRLRSIMQPKIGEASKQTVSHDTRSRLEPVIHVEYLGISIIIIDPEFKPERMELILPKHRGRSRFPRIISGFCSSSLASSSVQVSRACEP